MKITKTLILTAAAMFVATASNATEIEMNTARMQAMDKITGHVNVINVPVNGMVNFGSLSIVVRSCKTRPVEEAPENFAFVDITDKSLKGEEVNVFKGWMLSSSPATNALEHPIYDVWLLQCLNNKIEETTLLTEKQLSERDNLPMANRQNSQQTVAELKSDNSAAKGNTPTVNQQKAMSEMEYIQNEDEENKPENLLESQNTDTEFSFDEEDEDSAEIQNELNRINAEKKTKTTDNKPQPKP
mgnify:FL=1